MRDFLSGLECGKVRNAGFFGRVRMRKRNAGVFGAG